MLFVITKFHFYLQFFLNDGLIFGFRLFSTAKGNSPVTMNFAIPQVPEDLYNDFITEVDKTKIEA